jgi:hypothetical protein
VGGKPQFVSQQNLGSAVEVMAKLAGSRASEAVRTQHKSFGDVAATVGTYIALAITNRVVAQCSKLAFADW